MAITTFRCPYCKTSLGARSGMRENVADIGPSEVVCPGCQKVVATGSKEWSQMTAGDRAKVLAEVYLYYGLIVGPLIGAAAWWAGKTIWGIGRFASVLLAVAAWSILMLRVHFVHRKEVSDSHIREES